MHLFNIILISHTASKYFYIALWYRCQNEIIYADLFSDNIIKVYFS